MCMKKSVFRFYDPKVAEDVTSTSKELLRQRLKQIENYEASLPSNTVGGSNDFLWGMQRSRRIGASTSKE